MCSGAHTSAPSATACFIASWSPRLTAAKSACSGLNCTGRSGPWLARCARSCATQTLSLLSAILLQNVRAVAVARRIGENTQRAPSPARLLRDSTTRNKRNEDGPVQGGRELHFVVVNY
eukprot:scaffold18996_cov57-Phaeocystis_antarctica.AAC.7